jgi:PAS domain S-box-containing protein
MVEFTLNNSNIISKSKIDLSSEVLSLIIDNSPYGICYTSPQSEFLYTNKYYQNMVGYSDEELLNMTFFDILLIQMIWKKTNLLLKN